jgi:hypothetical protein
LIETLAASVVAILTPYVKKGAEKVIDEAGKVAKKKIGELLDTLKKRFSGDKEATDQLEYFEKDPETYKPVMEKILQRRMSEDKGLADELDKLLKEIREAAPNLEVVIKMEEGEEVTALEADELKKGTVKVEMDIKKGKKVTGPKIKRIG